MKKLNTSIYFHPRNLMTLFALPLMLLNLLSFVAPAPGPQGEGALAGDTPVLMADGSSKNLSDLKKGDVVQGWNPEKGLVPVVVKAVVGNYFNAYWAVRTAQGTLRTSANLWVASATGALVQVSNLQQEDLMALRETKLQTAVLTARRQYPANLRLFNLDLAVPGLYFAGGLLVHD